MPLWKLVFRSTECIEFTWESFYVRADSPEHAIRLGRAKIEGEFKEDPYYLDTLEYVASDILEDSVPE